MTRLAVWGVVASRPDLGPVIEALAERRGDAVFVPHVTLTSGANTGDEERLRIAMTEVDLRVALSLDTPRHDPEESRAVHLPVRPTPALTELRARVQSGVRGAPARAFAPHVTLVYGPLDEVTRAAIDDDLSARELPRAAHLSALALVSAGASHWRNRGRWRVIARAPLPAPHGCGT